MAGERRPAIDPVVNGSTLHQHIASLQLDLSFVELHINFPPTRPHVIGKKFAEIFRLSPRIDYVQLLGFSSLRTTEIQQVVDVGENVQNSCECPRLGDAHARWVIGGQFPWKNTDKVRRKTRTVSIY